MTAVLGIGVTGLSVARFLAARGEPFVMMDTRQAPAMLASFKSEFPQVSVFLAKSCFEQLGSVNELIVSPGLAPTDKLLVAAKGQGIKVVGDIELFARYAKAPVVAITGSNGKSTVTELLGDMARRAGVKVGVGGNLGVPALQLLNDNSELYVLELSSFQLEITESLKPAVACILNVSEDHLDRYASMADYLAAKQRIFTGARHIVFNRDDAATRSPLANVETSSFGVDNTAGDFSVAELSGDLWLCGLSGGLLPVSELRIKGRHNWANALAALAMGAVAGLPENAMLTSLREFPGLAHRCQTVRELQGVTYINDSKATNVGATLAALDGLAVEGQKNIVWVAGGDGKGADFSELKPAVAKSVKETLLIGKDGPLIARLVAGVCGVETVDTIGKAVRRAQQITQPGDLVLLSPACSSLDMFRNFEERGDAFVAAVGELP